MTKTGLSLWFWIPVLNTLQQIFLKESAEATAGEAAKSFIASLLVSPWFALAIVAEVVCFVLWLRVLAEVDLAKAFPISAISYVFILGCAWLFYAEPLSVLQLCGSAMILAGVWCIGAVSKEAVD